MLNENYILVIVVVVVSVPPLINEEVQKGSARRLRLSETDAHSLPRVHNIKIV